MQSAYQSIPMQQADDGFTLYPRGWAHRATQLATTIGGAEMTDVNKCECGAQVCARCGACRKEDRIFHSDCSAWGKSYRRHMWKWEPEVKQ